MKKIFVNIASYLDYQILPTLYDALLQAKYPDRLHICIIHQHDDKDKFLFDEFYNDPRVTIINIPYQQARGACYARHIGNQKYNNEDYVLMCDSHTRFIKNWDEELINMHNECLKYSDKPCISSYCALFEVNSEFPLSGNRSMFPAFKDKTGVLRFKNIEKNDNELRQHGFWGACFSFSSGLFFQEVPYDPELYFFGEEITIAVRAWTRGWDFYLPNKVILEHDFSYTNEDNRRIKHQHSSSLADKLNKKSLYRAKRICLGKVKGIFGHGNVRTLEEYQAAAGISFEDECVWHGNNLHYRPFPAFNSYKDFKKEIVPQNRFIDVNVDWSEHKHIVESCNEEIDFVKVTLSWEKRYKIIPVNTEKGMPYSATIKNFPMDLLCNLSAFVKNNQPLINMVEIIFYKQDEEGNFIKNDVFCINDDVNISYKYNDIEYNHISINSWGPKWIHYWKQSYYRKSVENAKRKKELDRLNNRVLFIHTPKCAGNSIVASINTYWESRKIVHLQLHYQHIKKKQLLEFWDIKETNNFKTLSVFRDPFDRLYSAYIFGFRQSKLKYLDEYKSFLFRKPYSFERFCKMLYQHYVDYNEFHRLILEPQHYYVEDLDGNLKDVYLLDYANLEQEWDDLCIKFNMGNKTKLLKLNNSKEKQFDFMSMYTEETKKMVEKIYEKDINIYQQVVDRQFTIHS